LLKQEAAGGALDLRQGSEANVDAGLEQSRQEGHRARQAIDLGNDQRGPV
jgi:hypothetical protein